MKPNEGVCFVERQINTVYFYVRTSGTDIKCRTKKLAEELALIIGAEVVEKHTSKLLRPGGYKKESVREIVYKPAPKNQ